MTALAIEPEVEEVEHGTWQAYRAGCRCEGCRRARAAYVALRRRSPAAHVGAREVRTHIGWLQEGGLTLAEIAQRSGVSRRTVERIATGQTLSCATETRSRILGVPSRLRTVHISSPVPAVEDSAEPDEPDFTDPLSALRLLLDPSALAWKAEAECARLDIDVDARQRWFFPTRGQATGPALAICSRCPCWAECLGFSLAYGMEGIWGRSAGAHRRRIVTLGVTVEELADAGMRDDPALSIAEALERVVAGRAA